MWLGYSGFAINGTTVGASFESSRHSPVRFEAVVRVPLSWPADESHTASTLEWPIVNGYSDARMTARRSCTHADLGLIGEGWYEAQASPLPLFPRAQFRWRPSSCDFAVVDAAAVRRSVSKRWVAFLGDSTTGELSITLLLTAGVTIVPPIVVERCDKYEYDRSLDTGWHAALDNGRISFLWASNDGVCGVCLGLQTFDNPEYVAKVSARLTLNGTPSLLVFNSGIHDVFCISKPPVLLTAPAINETLSRFPGRLDRVLTLLRGIVGPDCVIVWKFTTPGERYLQLLLETLNQEAIRVVQQHASRGPVALFDDSGMLLPMQTLGQHIGDRNPFHCSTANKDHNLTAIGYACVAVAGALALLSSSSS